MRMLDRIERVLTNNQNASPEALDAYYNASFAVLAARLEGDREALAEAREARREAREEIRAERDDYLQFFREARDEAKAVVDDARADVRAAREALQEARGEGREAVRDAREALKEAREAVKEARAELREAREDMQQARADWKDGSAIIPEPPIDEPPVLSIDDELITFPEDETVQDDPNTNADDFIAGPMDPDMVDVTIDFEPPKDLITDPVEPESEFIIG